MFGYVTLNPNGATDEEKRRYRQYYCGLCKALEHGYGRTATKALSYDMTFLYMLLADLYNQEGVEEREHCVVHPVKGRSFIASPVSSYCAAMQLLLSWHVAEDKAKDDGSAKAERFMAALRDDVDKVVAAWPRQSCAVREALAAIAGCEARDEKDVDIPSGHFASLLGEVFCPYDDIWRRDLMQIGQGLGRFVYILDAWDDLDKDRRKGAYNPFSGRVKDDGFKKEVREELEISASLAAEALERLPLDRNLSILRNCVYSGIWTRFEGIRKK